MAKPVIETLQKLLRIPISNVKKSGEKVIIESDGIEIGALNVIQVFDGVTSYDDSTATLNSLKWSLIFEKYKPEFQKKIAAKFTESNIQIISATFRKVYVKDKTGKTIGYVDMYYDNEKWKVNRL